MPRVSDERASPSDRSRREFLGRLERPFRALAPDCVVEFGDVPPFPGFGLRVVVPGRPGFVSVLPVSLAHNVKSWGDPFPGDGVPHWDLTAHDEDGQLGDQVFACRIEVVADAFGTWLGLAKPAPALRGRPAAKDHLLAAGRATEPAPPATLPGEAVAAAAGLPEEERRRFQADTAALALRRIARLFPRGDNGRVATGERVLLCGYGPEDGGRRRWLHVGARQGLLQVALAPLIGENHLHRWDQARWMWDVRLAPPPPPQRWGIAADQERARRALELLDSGNVADALALYGIGATGDVARVLAGEPLSMQEAALAPRWADELRRVLWELAPWQLGSALPDGAGVRARLVTFGGQRQIRKASLVLARTAAGPELAIDYTGTNRRLPRTAFARLAEQDLARFEIAVPELPDEAELPEAELPDEAGTPLVVAPPAPVEAGKQAGVLAAKLRHLQGSGYDAALAAGRKLDPAVAGQVLAAAMDDADPQVRSRACTIAGALRNHACLGAGMARLDDGEPLVRDSAAQYLRRIGHRPALAVVARRMLTNPEDFLIGASMLRNFGDKPGAETLRRHLAAAEPDIRTATCLTVVQYGGKALAPLLLQAAAGDVAQVAAAALRALEVLAVPAVDDARARVAGRADAAEVEREHARFAAYRRS
jgi:hypothetical protein